MVRSSKLRLFKNLLKLNMGIIAFIDGKTKNWIFENANFYQCIAALQCALKCALP